MKWKNTARRISLLLIISILAGCLLTACNGKKEDVQMGRYTEKELQGLLDKSRVLSAKTNESGNIVIYAYGGINDGSAVTRSVLPKDGGTLQTTEVDWANELIGDTVAALDFDEGSDGTAYLLYMDYITRQYQLARYQNGAVDHIEIDGWNTASPIDSTVPDDIQSPDENGEEDPDNMKGTGGSISIGGVGNVQAYDEAVLYPLGVNAIDNGDFLITYSASGIYRYEASGEKVLEYSGSPYKKAVVDRQRLAFFDAETGGIIVCDLNTGKTLENYSYNGDALNVSLAMDDENVYVADNNGIHRLSPDGKETVVDGGLTSLMIPTYSIDRLLASGEDKYFCILSDEDGAHLMQYQFDETVSASPSKELNIYTLYDNNTIRQAIGVFQKNNPNVCVNLTVAMADESSATVEDVIRSLNTQLLNGTGPDLIVLDGLPIQSYIEKGILSDISELVSRLTASEGLMKNMMSTYTQDGKTYAVPSRFTLPVMVGESESLSGVNSLSDLAALVKSGQSGTPAFFVTPSDLWTSKTGSMMKYYDALVKSFTNEDGSLDKEALESYFSDMLEIDAALKENSPQSGDDFYFSMAMGGDSSSEVLDTGSWSLRDGNARVHIQELIGMMGLLSLGGDLGEKPEMELKSLFDDEMYYPVAGIGITSTSARQVLAEQFIETLMSSEVQSKYLYDGYPVNTGAMDAMIEENLGGNKPISDMEFVELCKKLTTPVFVDDVVKSAVTEQISGLLDGSVTPAEAAQNVVDKTRIYLAE